MTKPRECGSNRSGGEKTGAAYLAVGAGTGVAVSVGHFGGWCELLIKLEKKKTKLGFWLVQLLPVKVSLKVVVRDRDQEKKRGQRGEKRSLI